MSRSARSALVSNQAAEHELRTALRNINNMKQAAAQEHAQQVQQFLGSISNDVPVENVAPEITRKLLQRRNSRSMDDVTLLDNAPRKTIKRPDTLPLRNSSSQADLGLPNIQKKSPLASTPTKSISSSPRSPSTPRKQISNGKIKRMAQLASTGSDASSCPNSPLVSRKKKAERLDINFVPVTISGRVRCSSFTSPASPEDRVCSSSFTSTSPTTSGVTSVPSPRKLRAQVKKTIQSNLEASRKEAARKKRLLEGKDGNSWKDQMELDQIERSDSEEKPAVVSPYSISSSMKICGTPGTFEKQTGKQGLKAWMGKAGPKANKKK